MTTKRKAIWWMYSIAGFALILFLAPALISATDTVMVLSGMTLLVLFGVWSWHLWVMELINKSKELLK